MIEIISELISSQKELSKVNLIVFGNRYAPEIEESIKNSFSSEIGSLHLDETVSLGYTLKALFVGLRAYLEEKFNTFLLCIQHRKSNSKI
jgi:hypothetical protein